MAWSRNAPIQAHELRALLERAGVDPTHWPWRRDTVEGIGRWTAFEAEVTRIREESDAGTAYEFTMHRLLERWRRDPRNPQREPRRGGRPKGTTTIQSLDEVRQAISTVAEGEDGRTPKSDRFTRQVAAQLSVQPSTLKKYIKDHSGQTYARFRNEVLAAAE